MALEKEKIDEVLKKLPDELREEVLKFAKALLQIDHNRDARESDQNGSGSVKEFFGIWDSGDPRSADNDRIDFDLANQFSNSPETDS